MSYDLVGYILRPDEHPEAIAAILNGKSDVEEYASAPLSLTVRDRILSICGERGFTVEEVPGSIEFTKDSLQISVFEREVGISVPYWEEAKPLLDEALAIVEVLSDTTSLRFWDPQEGAWVDGKSQASTFNGTVQKMERVVQRQGAKPPSRPWWRFWG